MDRVRNFIIISWLRNISFSLGVLGLELYLGVLIGEGGYLDIHIGSLIPCGIKRAFTLPILSHRKTHKLHLPCIRDARLEKEYLVMVRIS